MFAIMLQSDDPAALPHVNVVMTFLHMIWPVAKSCAAAVRLLRSMPWGMLVSRLNALSSVKENMPDRVKTARADQTFMPDDAEDIPLIEDFAMRGLLWCRDFFPEKWFDRKDKDELPHHEPAIANCIRAQRILWSAVKLSIESPLLEFDRASGRFEAGDITTR